MKAGALGGRGGRAHEKLVWGEKTWTEREQWWEGALEVSRKGEGDKVGSDRVAEQKENGKCEQMLRNSRGEGQGGRGERAAVPPTGL